MDSVPTYCLCGQPYNPDIFMIQCDCCREWFHGNCVRVKEYELIEIDKYHCPLCVPQLGPSIAKKYQNWHRHDFWDAEAQGKPVQTGTAVFIRELATRHFSSEGEIVLHVRGQQLTESYLRQYGFNNPVVVDGKDGLDLTVPGDYFSLYDVESYIGSEREIDVIDVMRQSDFKMNLRDFVEYFNLPHRTRIFNVVSLEVSNTSLAQLIEAPLVARKLDWVNTVWPRDVREDSRTKPQVQKYCLMSVKDSYTDFHIDFGGTSVWYHVLRGEKIFYFIRPTPANLTLYQQWMTSSNQSETFFGDQVDQCFKCTLRQGQTMFIPTGWIHAVLTPVDSLVFGGNFLHSLNISMQLQVYDIEKKVKTADRFKYPLFETINWYAAKKLMCQLKEVNDEQKKCSTSFLAGVKALLAVLKQWNTDKDYNMSNREQIPDVINSHKLLKDLGKEIRHAERYLNSLNPPKPERESKRKRKKPVNKDFIDFTQISPKTQEAAISLYDTAAEIEFNQGQYLPPPPYVRHTQPIKLTLPKPAVYPYTLDSSTKVPDSSKFVNNGHSRPEQTTAIHQGGTVMKFKLGTKDIQPVASTSQSNSVNLNLNSLGIKTEPNSNYAPSSVYDFNSDNATGLDDEDSLYIDESPKRRRFASQVQTTGTLKMRIPSSYLIKNESDNEVDVISEIPKNGIESLLKASALTTMETGRTSPSTREAIAGMLSISQAYPNQKTPKTSRSKRRYRMSSSEEENGLANVHQDEEYIYLPLDNSDDDDSRIFKSRGKNKTDEAWNPKARVGPLLPKMNRPAREGTKKQSVEKVLEAAAAKRAIEPSDEVPAKRTYKKKKAKLVKQSKQNNETKVTPSASSSVKTTSSSVANRHRKPKGQKTVKQRLGKILGIHKMMH